MPDIRRTTPGRNLNSKPQFGKGGDLLGESQPAAPPKWEAPPGAAKSGIDCVFLTCFDSDVHFLANVLLGSGIRMHRAETLEQADFLLTATDGTVLLSDTSFLDGYWNDALDMLARFHPLVASAVIADQVDRQFVSEAPQRGACGVLWKPLEWGGVCRFIRTAHEATGERMIWQHERCAGDRIGGAISLGVTMK